MTIPWNTRHLRQYEIQLKTSRLSQGLANPCHLVADSAELVFAELYHKTMNTIFFVPKESFVGAG